MQKKRATLTGALVMLLALMASMFVAPAAQASPAPAAAAASSYRVVGYIYTDWHFEGIQKPIVFKDYGDCDRAGYTVRDTWGASQMRYTSSIANSAMSPNCNAAVVTTTYGGTVLIRIPSWFVGPQINDLVHAIRFCRYPC